ncbi:four-carbon acid sugar kinase family protein [Runella sp. MFBS21]|uniref:four-carbon acid sugar kinase family protein n=1 Tax=Runella sp. MFBS21 TaxID=3034018 RepID=UPI0023F9D8C0|nr:four-carbon acid sugar kinase family protein [Runella sp. MFBS21]MDF7817776.1 four-carbon acid sugar kinase family protein [Runella sp. MFBS21]
MSLTNSSLLLAYYGDDFTGSTDALEFMSRAGARTVLFIEPPTLAQLAQYEDLQAIGVAGLSRSLSPQAMEQQLRPVFEALQKLNSRHIHYKVCSTFDSSPTIGSIGKALEIGAEVFESEWVPILVAAPSLGRYCTFGNLFARMGIGSQGVIHRLDRHPSMRVHPVTPATESDLRLHLAQQTTRKTGLLDILQIAQANAVEKLAQLLQQGYDNVLFDALYEQHLPIIGQLIDQCQKSKNQALFSVGSSGIEMALGSYWQTEGILSKRTQWNKLEPQAAILVISGSCSPVSAQQIAWAERHGFVSIGLDTTTIAAHPNDDSVLNTTIEQALTYAQAGRSIIIHSSSSNLDPRIKEANDIFIQQGFSPTQIQSRTGQLFGRALGIIAKEILASSAIERIVVAGGDTSSYAARAMEIEAVEMIAPLTPGAPVCVAHAPHSALHQKQIIFKGGQVGPENYYELVRGVG